MTPGAAFLARLDAVTVRLDALAQRTPAAGSLTDPDPPTGERWEAGQVWAHIAEFIPYWLAEFAQVVERRDPDGDAFGRTKTDPVRIAAIDRGRHEDAAALWPGVRSDIAHARAWLASLDPGAWVARGRHSTLGTMDLAAMLDEFLVGHLEQHAEQLEGLAG